MHSTGLVASEHLLWLHAHTGCMPRDSGLGWDRNRSGAAHVYAATYSKSEVDLADRDARFPSEWNLTIHYYRDVSPL